MNNLHRVPLDEVVKKPRHKTKACIHYPSFLRLIKCQKEIDKKEVPAYTRWLYKPPVKRLIADMAGRIDYGDVAMHLYNFTDAYEHDHKRQLMEFMVLFNRYFYFVRASDFPWRSFLMQSSLKELIKMPLCYISKDVYMTCVWWMEDCSAEALNCFFLWLLDDIFSDLTRQQSVLWNRHKLFNYKLSKSKIATFIVMAMLLRVKPDVLIENLTSLREDPKYNGQDKFPVLFWVICQASEGDRVVGMYSWVRNLLPVVSNPYYKDLVLQLVERILSRPKARSNLLNAAVDKERLIPLTSLEQLLQVTYPSPAFQVEGATERFQAVYPTLKELALAGSPRTEEVKQVILQLLPIALNAGSNADANPEFSKEVTHILLWCCGQNIDSEEQLQPEKERKGKKRKKEGENGRRKRGREE